MNDSEKLKNARNLLLKLHKVMLDREREVYEGINGPLKPTQFLNVLLEDLDFDWLRKFSMLIVEIDELFAAKDGTPAEMVSANLAKVEELIEMREHDEFFKAKYQFSLQSVPEAAALHSEIKLVLTS
ncbi:MAG: hypothetical protein IPG67_18305 [Acidobacteria bacterium]|nr:hypothetical protein [Acidobacteriota bacterium]MBK7934374.1 hypothetical protein [Acidobacteriota bacterium]